MQELVYDPDSMKVLKTFDEMTHGLPLNIKQFDRVRTIHNYYNQPLAELNPFNN